MKNRGQAALEYLMTYGWALIVIAIVVGVLVFIVTTPTDTISCSSTQPSKINVVSHNIGNAAATETVGDIVLTNVSGGQISSVNIIGDTGLFALDASSGAYAGAGTDTMPVGNTTVALYASATTTTDYSTGSLTIEYNDAVGLSQTASVNCQGASVTIT